MSSEGRIWVCIAGHEFKERPEGGFCTKLLGGARCGFAGVWLEEEPAPEPTP